VDSGASFHATPYRKYFLDYTAGNLGQVLLGDDAACKIVRKGTIALKLPNGNEWILKEVRHIPALRRNLISTGQLDEESCISCFRKKQWKVTKGALVITRGDKVGTLYLYKGSLPPDFSCQHSKCGCCNMASPIGEHECQGDADYSLSEEAIQAEECGSGVL